MSRIIAGDAKSLVLVGPASGTRPTSDRVRESLFAVLVSQGWLSEVESVLDLFCGTGALALEAVSRGANRAVFVDSSAAAIEVSRKNCDKLSAALSKRAEGARAVSLQTVRAKVAPWLRKLHESRFDLVFADPPYELEDSELWQQLSALQGLLAADGLLVIERPKRRTRSAEPDWLTAEFTRIWGDTEVSAYRLRSAGPT